MEDHDSQPSSRRWHLMMMAMSKLNRRAWQNTDLTQMKNYVSTRDMLLVHSYSNVAWTTHTARQEIK